MFHQNSGLGFITILKLKFSPAKGLEIVLKYTTELKVFMDTCLSRSFFTQRFVFETSIFY